MFKKILSLLFVLFFNSCTALKENGFVDGEFIRAIAEEKGISME